MSKKSAAATAKPAAPAQETSHEPINMKLPESNATSHLFPETIPPAEETPPAVVVPPQEVPVEPTAPVVPPAPESPAVPSETPAPTTPTPTPTDETFLEDLLAKSNIPLDKLKVRIKVDGKEEVLSYEEAKKRVQLKEHLNLAGQQLGVERRTVAEERKKWSEEQRSAQFPGAQRQPVPTNEQIPVSDPLIAQLIDKVNMLESRQQGLDPVIFDVNRQRVAGELKSQGFPDFLDYIPKMEAHISALKDQNAIQYYDTEIGSKALYHELKNRDLMEQMQRAQRPTPPAPMPQKVTSSPEHAPIIVIDGGSQPSQAGLDNYDAKYQEKLSRWQKTRDPVIFRELLAMRGAGAK